ncbi:MAG: hypothetical protein M1820_001932 [Bogoriella megaspora]|nr:MAG: hypothetical protein M1820_001932 [Bogoriella megaspora]
MPLHTFHLLRLSPSTSPTQFLTLLRSEASSTIIILASRPQFLVISPTSLDISTFTHKPWDLLLLLQPSSPSTPYIPLSLRPHIIDEYTLHVGIPSRIANTYPAKNASLQSTSPTAPLTNSLFKPILHPSSQNLTLSPSLSTLASSFEKTHAGPVTQLNLLRFQPSGKESYATYGREFVRVAGKRGGDAKIVGSVIQKEGEEGWDEISLVHYPSIRHFCDMLAGEDYQEINERYRLPALKDTVLMCTTEGDLLEEGRGQAKL